MNKPLVSIIVPVFNVKKYIERCVTALFEQSFPNIEYIFVDDCSPDDSIDNIKMILQKYPERADSVRFVVHEQNKGIPSARNSGLKAAMGDYIYHCDSDDWVETSLIEDLLNTMQSSDADIAWCDFNMQVEGSGSSWISESCKEKKEDVISAMLTEKIHSVIWNKLVKRELYDRYAIRFLDGYAMGDDRNVATKLVSVSNRVKYLPKPLYNYRINPNSICNAGNGKKNNIARIENIKEILRFLEANNVEWISHDDLDMMKMHSKREMLFSSDLDELLSWGSIFPESNRLVFKCKEIPFQHRFLALLCIGKQRQLLKLWLWTKGKRRN